MTLTTWIIVGDVHK